MYSMLLHIAVHTNMFENKTLSLFCVIHILKMMMEQNYFQFDQQYYKQTYWLAMEASSS
jgi:hypothetical protein